MPNNNDDLRNRLAVLEQQLGLRDNTNVSNRNNTNVQDDLFSSSSNIKSCSRND